MIPPLVQLIALLHDRSWHGVASAVLGARRDGSVGSARTGLPSEVDGLPMLPAQRLVPSGTGEPLAAQLLEATSDLELTPRATTPHATVHVRAGLYLVHDYLDAAHQLVQEGTDRTAAYWHAIMHRREPDYGNSKYWFRRVGRHPVHADIARDIAPLRNDSNFRDKLKCDRLLDSQSGWDPVAFVDLCQECGSEWDDRARTAAVLQEIEMRRLLEHACRLAYG